MNQKQFITLIVLGLAIGGLGIYFNNKRKESFTASAFQTGDRVIKDFPLNDIAQMRLLHGTNELNLARGDEGWTVKERYDYPANFSEISEFLRKVWELKPVQDVQAGASQHGRLELLNPKESPGATNSGTLVEFKDGKGTILKSLILGKKATRQSEGGPFGGGGEFPIGRYVLVPENPPRIWLVNETFSNIETSPEQWLNKDFFKVEKVKAVSVTAPEETNSWSISRETEGGEWKMAKVAEGENFDSAKASSLNYVLSSPSFNDVASPDTKIEGENERATAKIETFDGFTYTVRIGTSTNEDNMLLKVSVAGNFEKERKPGADEKPEDKERLDKEFKEKLEKLQEKLKNEQKFEKWTYQISKWTVDSLLKPRKDFMTEKKEEAKSETSSAEDSHDHDKAKAAPAPPLPGDLSNILPPGLEPAEQ